MTSSLNILDFRLYRRGKIAERGLTENLNKTIQRLSKFNRRAARRTRSRKQDQTYK